MSSGIRVQSTSADVVGLIARPAGRDRPRALINAFAAISSVVTGAKPGLNRKRERAWERVFDDLRHARARTQLGSHIATAAMATPGGPR